MPSTDQKLILFKTQFDRLHITDAKFQDIIYAPWKKEQIHEKLTYLLISPEVHTM